VPKGEREYLKRFIKVILVLSIILTLSYMAVPVRCDPAAILKVSLPDGTYVGFSNDPWLSECWLLNVSGCSQTFSLMINNTSRGKRSYDTHLIIALNDAGYQNLESLIINGTEVPKSAFRFGRPKPYGIWDWPSGDVYPTWFNDTIINVGTVPRKGFVTLIVSVTFSDANGVRMHFDAYGSKVYPPPPTKSGGITHNSLSQDSTVLFQPGPPPPQSPLASFTYIPTYPETYEIVTFNATESYDPDGYIVQYTWDFGDGNVTSTSNPIITHVYEMYGEYDVTLTVMDNDGLTEQAATVLYVSQCPVASFTFSPSDSLAHEIVTFDASASTPDGGVLVSYEWDFGDGNITSTSDPIITHAYDTYGTYTVTLNVTDSEGKWDITSKIITVESVPIADFFWTPYYPQRYENVTFDASTSTPDGGTIIKYAWDFGDGTPIVEETDPITFHIYSEIGNYTVTLNITDSEGRWDTISKTVTVVPRRFYLEVATDPEGITTIPGEGGYNEGASVNLTAPDIVMASDVMRYIFAYWNVSGEIKTERSIIVIMDANRTATAYYTTQYLVTFSQTRLDNTATGIIVTINSIQYGFADLPYSVWADEGATFTYSYQDIVLSSSAGKRFKLIDISGPTSPFTVTGPVTVTANYKTQYQVTFDQTGLDSSAIGTVVTVDGSPLDYGSLPFSQWIDEGTSITYSYEAIVSSSIQGKRFILSSVTGSTSPFTVDSPKAVVGNYVTQYYLTVTSPFGIPSGEGWYDAGTTAYAELDTGLIDHGNGTRRMFVSWSGDASGTNYVQSDPIIMDAPKEAVASWQTQYYLTVRADPPGITTIPGEGWYNESETVTLTAPDVAGYQFNYWDVNETSKGAGVNPIMVTMDAPYVATAHYTAITPQYTLTIITTTGGTTDPPPGSYTYDEGTIVSVTAIPEENYKFDHWELNGTFYSDQLTVEVTMDNNYELKAFFEYLSSLSVSVSPSSATIYLGESVTFTASPSGGVAPYSYQWYVNNDPVLGATSDTWTFTPSAAGIYYVHVVVTDSENQTAQSSASRVVVQEKVPTVGGAIYPVTFTPEPENSPRFPATFTLILVGIALSVFVGARKLKKSK